MKILNDKFDKLVATATTRYRHVSENFAKHLRYQHPFSTRRHAQDQADGMLGYGTLVACDGYFFAKERAGSYASKNGTAVAYPASGDIIALCEWPTWGRIHDLHVYASDTGANGTVVGTANTAYFDANTSAAFPAFTLQANDPNDPTFTPIPLRETVGGVTRLSMAALAYGINKRRDPLIIEAVLGGNVVANSGLVVRAEFAMPMP